MKYKTVKDILCAMFTEDEIKLEGYNEFMDATDRLHDPRPYPIGISQDYFNRFIHSDPNKLPFPSDKKKKKFKKAAHDFRREYPHIDIYKDANEVQSCAIRSMYY